MTKHIIGLPDVGALKELLSYDPTTGSLVWRERGLKHCKSDHEVRRWNSRYCGKEAFAIHPSGYRRGYVLSMAVQAHRAAWAIYYGEWPEGDVDHINGNRADNRICNLRDVSRSHNARNGKHRANNKSGRIGVCKFGDKWRAYINGDCGIIHLGIHNNFDDAVAARELAEKEMAYGPNHGRKP